MVQVSKMVREVDVIDAEVLETTEEALSFPEKWSKTRKRKKPRGTRKKDFPKFTAKVREEILAAAGMGVPLDLAAYNAMVSPQTVKQWLDRGKELVSQRDRGEKLVPIEKDFADFYEDYYRAVSRPSISLIGTVMRESRRDGKLALEMLGKLAPEYFGAKAKVEISGGVTHDHRHTLEPGQAVVKELTDDQIRQLRSNIKALPEGAKDEEDN